MYIELEKKIYKKVLEETNSFYGEPINREDKVILEVEYISQIIEDLLDKNDSLKDKIDDLKEDMDNNYELKREDLYDTYGVSRNDF